MSVNIGAPQAILLALYIMSLVINCVKDGELVRCGDCIHFGRCPMRKGDGSGYCWQAKRREERNGDE